MMEPRPQITSSKNPLVRRFREAAAGEPPEVMVVEGPKLVAEALAAELPVDEAAIAPRLLEHPLGMDLRRRLDRAAAVMHECSDAVLERLSSVTTHQGVAAIVRRPAWSLDDVLGRGGSPLVVVAAGIKDPGNLGALVRTAEAAQASGLLALEGGADPFRDKAVRAAAGSVFRLPVLAAVTLQQLMELAKRRALQVMVAEGQGDVAPWDADLRVPTVLVVGGEGAGVPEELRARATVRVRIPMAPTVDSLNVAVAAGVLLYEARRQRR